jgi:hypothetical protein
MNYTPKEKANVLLIKFVRKELEWHQDENVLSGQISRAKEKVLILCDEIIENINTIDDSILKIDNVNGTVFSTISYSKEYWEDVKTEVNSYGE